MSIQIVKGDLFKGVEQAVAAGRQVLIPHVVNNKGGWGKGFVVPLAKHYPFAKERYERQSYELGTVAYCGFGGPVGVANMVAQDGYASKTNPRPLRYYRLAECLSEVTKAVAKDHPKREIHMPKFGTGLAGGDWTIIREMVEDAFDGLDVYIYEL